jgi:DNA-binding LytR/AlgR family response regulator
MKPLNCLIVDDEPIAREILLSYCGYLPSLRVVGECTNALEAKVILDQINVDILFLDIHLPVLDGINFYNTLKKPPQVIFTTAFKEYAVDAFELAACDYLVKPFLLDRFIIAVDKAVERINPLSEVNKAVDLPSFNDSFFVRTEGKIYNIQYSELLFAEAQGNYTKMVTTRFTAKPNMSFINTEKILPPSIFKRVHRSYILNQSKISHIEGNRVFIGQYEIPVGSNYKEEFFKSLGL